MKKAKKALKKVLQKQPSAMATLASTRAFLKAARHAQVRAVAAKRAARAAKLQWKATKRAFREAKEAAKVAKKAVRAAQAALPAAMRGRARA
jgi:hypothetical protein